MKNLITILCLCSFLFSKTNILDDIRNKQLDSDTSVKDIFMDFQFGDSQEVVKQKFNMLLKSGDIYIEDGIHTYDFNVRSVLEEYFDVIGKTNFVEYYHDNKLYKLSLIVRPFLKYHDDIWDKYKTGYTDDETRLWLTGHQIQGMYRSKYGEPDYRDFKIRYLDEEDIENGTEFYNIYFIEGNREISIQYVSKYITINYIDLRIKKEVEDVEKKSNEIKNKKKIEEWEKNKSDI